MNRQIRFIQTEGHFGDIKEKKDLRRFHYRTSDKVYREFLLYTIGRNLNRFHRFYAGNQENTNRTEMETQLKEDAKQKIGIRGFYALKTEYPKKRTPLIENPMSKNIDSIKGVLIFALESQKSIFPDCPFFSTVKSL